MENLLRKANNNQKGINMRSILVALVFGFFVSAVVYAQDKTDKNCCSTEKCKTSMSKMCDVPDEASVSSYEKDDMMASIQGDNKNKKVEKNLNSTDKNMKKDKMKSKSSEDGCCSPDKKKTEKVKTSN